MKKLSLFFTAIILSILLISCSQDQAGTTDNTNANETEDNEGTATYPNANLLVDVEWVANHLDDENVQFVDLRGEGYEGGHIPGASHITWPEIADPESPYDGVLLPAEPFAALMQEIGIDQDETVVIYDDGSSLSAARLFYALEYYGHQNLKIFNGGFTAWLNAGEDVSTESPEITKGDFVATANEKLVCDLETVEASLDDDNVIMLDTRSEEEYTGENLRAERGGHVPNAVHIEWSEAVEDVDGVPSFKSFDELTALYEEKGVTKDKTIVPYCQTNVRGAHTYFTLRLLGYDSIKPYEGSWAEYGNVSTTKIEK
ncbi:sulfurtransferase [Aquibacillus albus]|uniref:thiosulfate sulfurtransferase n=1 Tax=Aquibacillus albus TaxID=1168171 RepID=A0ABS2N6F8_9BACI|nr:sulfurtransferase [Aquibacillus albus]MBM7573716.1 thiosulfate/3-mercaptopyruvate sulfurtransferase [Aquibacillus albus]